MWFHNVKEHTHLKYLAHATLLLLRNSSGSRTYTFYVHRAYLACPSSEQ
jgi:hypothetical protein